MIVQFVQFETSLSEEEVLKVARDRLDEYRAVPGLVQKFYLKLNKPNHYGGFHVWQSREAMMAFRETETAKTIPSAYKVIGAPDVEVHDVFFPLRDVVDFGEALETA